MAKAVSVDAEGNEDGWSPPLGWFAEVTPNGDTRLVVSLPDDRLAQVHGALVRAMAEPLSFLYRQKIDRRNPRPQGAPPKDHVGLGLGAAQVIEALEVGTLLFYNDARCEVWLRGAMGEQLVLDDDGVLFIYPDDPSFRDALTAAEVPEADVETLKERDYIKHWFHAECDALEDDLIKRLGLSGVPHR